MKFLCKSKKGQFSIIAALLVSVILVSAVISSYTLVRHSSIKDSPEVLTAVGEMNSGIKSILDFTVGYYGSILQVTGNSTYARELTTSYLSSGLVNVARSHPEWNPSFRLDYEHVSTKWFMPESYSQGEISVTYSLEALGIEGVTYQTASALSVSMLESGLGQARINVTRDGSEPELGLTKENFWFYKYNYIDSKWEQINPTNVVISSNGVYALSLPPGISQDSYSIKIEDNRGIVVSAFYSQASVASVSKIPHYSYFFDWDSTGVLDIYDSLSTDTFLVELLQNGTLKWLGQNFDLVTGTRPIPPIPIKAFRLNATISGVNQEIPFQVEDWASEYMVPLGLAGNDSIFSNNNMLVFQINNEITDITLWWDGNDEVIQTNYAWENIYFNDNPSSGRLDNGFLHLDINNFYIISRVIGESETYRTDFLRMNNDMPDYGAEPAYVIYNGIVRDIVQQEPEYGGGGVSGSPNFYSQLYITLPANTPYYTYAARLIFVDSIQSRTIDDLSVIQLSISSGTPLTEDGTSGGYPESSSSTGLFYASFPSGWDHHWSQINSGNDGAGFMFTDADNQDLYVFDDLNERGALNIQNDKIEVNPIDPSLSSVSFLDSKDYTWFGAIVSFNDEPIYREVDDFGLWVMVENPPEISMDKFVSGFDYVDILSNVDSSADKGSHSVFNAQKSGPDLVFDTITESMVGGDVEDYVDNNISNIDSSEDIGSHSSFSAQQIGPDSVFDTLTEASESENTHSFDASGGYMIVGDDVDWGSVAGTISFWIKMDSSVQGRLWGQNGNMETRWSGNNLVLDWDGTSSLTSATNFFSDTWYFVAIVWDENTNDLLLYIGDDSNPPTLDSNSLIGTWSGDNLPSPTQNRFMNGLDSNQPVDGHGDDLRYWNVARTLIEIQNDYNIELTGSEPNLKSYYKLNNNFDDIGPDNNDGYGSGSYSFSTDVIFSGSQNYNLDLEVQFINIADFLPNNELCIYTGALDDEDLKVDYWTGSNWVNLATDLNANSWNNYSVPILSNMLTLKFSGGTEVGDLSEDQWELDTVLLKSYGNANDEKTVDNDASNIDASPDLGDLVNFINMQTLDSTFSDLLESNPSSGITFVDVAENTNEGTDAEINKPANTQENDFMIALLVSTIGYDDDGSLMSNPPSGWTLQHNYIRDAYSGQHVYIYWKIAGDTEPSSYTWVWDDSCGWVGQINTFRGVDVSSPIHMMGTVNQENSNSPTSPSITTTENNCMIWIYDMCDDNDIGGSGGIPSGTSAIDYTERGSPGNGLGISTAYFVQSIAGATGDKDWSLDNNEENAAQQFALKPGSTAARLDQEVQWIDIPYSLPNEELAIFCGSMGDEDIVVDVWTGTDWETVFTDLIPGWNNVSINTWLTSSTFTIRFTDGIGMGDSTQDNWQIDTALINLWNEEGDSYELDLEVQWTSVDFDETNEELCIYVNSTSSENLGVDVWTGSTWDNLFSNLSVGWNNATVSSYLTTSTFTIRFIGQTEVGDVIEDIWAIDATLLHTWT